MADPLDLIQKPAAGQIGFGLGWQANAPLPASGFQQEVEREKRKAGTLPSDVIGAVWRQDGLADALVANAAGRTLAPDPKYNPFTDPRMSELEKSLQDEFKPFLYQAHSAAHADYIHTRLLQKQSDLQILGDLDTPGVLGRLALNVLMPDQLLIGAGAGTVSRLFRAGTAAARAGTAVSRAEGAVADAVGAASRAASKSAVAAGTAAGAAGNVAYEAFRQSINFESDDTAKLEAALMGAAFSFPFALVGARQSRRALRTLQDEHEVLKGLKAHEEGRPLTPEQARAVNDIFEKSQLVGDLERGLLDPDEFADALRRQNEATKDLLGEWRKQFDAELDGRIGAVKEALGLGQAGEPIKAPTVSPEMRAQMDARVAREDANFAPKRAPEPATPDAPVPAPEKAPGEGQLAAALREALTKAERKRQRAIDLEDARVRDAGLLSAEEAAAQEAQRAARKAAFEAAEAADEAAKGADYERMLNARELLRATAEGVDAPAVPAPEVPKGPTAESFVGKTVRWLDLKGDGNVIEGTVERVHPETGRLMVRDEDGKLRSVAHTDVEDWTGDAPPGFIAKGSIGAGQRQLIGAIAKGSTAMRTIRLGGKDTNIPARFDLYNFLNGSDNEAVRTLAHSLIKDPVGNKEGAPQDFTASEWRDHQVRLVNGEFHRVSRDALREAIKAAQVPLWQRRQFAQDFYSAASVYLRVGDDRVLQSLPQAVHAHVKAVSAAQRKALDTHLDYAKKAGVKGAQDVTADDAYVNRVWNHQKIREAMELHGEDSVYEVLAAAMTGMTPQGPLTGNVEKAKKFLSVVRRLEFTPALSQVHLAGRDMATLRSELRALKMSDSDIDTVVDVMFQARENAGSDAGQAPNLRFRFDLDESVAIQTRAGQLSITDLLENDARILTDLYGRSLAGHTALARVGITSNAEWAAKVKEITDEALRNPQASGPRLAREIQWLEDIHSHILGRPMSMADFSFTARTAAAFRGYTRSIMLGQLGITAAFEMKQAVGMMGMRAFLTQVPSFGAFISALRKGHLPDVGLARDIMHISGWGQEKAAAYARAREIDEGLAAQALTKFESFSNDVSHAVDIMSGNASFTSLTRQISGTMAAQQLHDFATGLKSLSDPMKLRLSGQGLDGQWLTDTMAALKQHSVSKDGVLQGIDHETWARTDPETYEKFQLFISRQVRDAIQDHDLGETMPFMHSTLGKMFSELKTFFLVAHAKNMLKNLHYADATTMQVLLIGMMGEALAWALQQAINFPSEVDKRITPEAMGRAVFFRLASLGFLPMMVESGYNIASGGDSLMSPGMTANTDNRSFLKTPSMQVAGRLIRAPQTLAGMALGTDVTTKSEFKDLIETLPGSRLIGVRGLVDWFASSFPASDPSKTPSR